MLPLVKRISLFLLFLSSATAALPRLILDTDIGLVVLCNLLAPNLAHMLPPYLMSLFTLQGSQIQLPPFVYFFHVAYSLLI